MKTIKALCDNSNKIALRQWSRLAAFLLAGFALCAYAENEEWSGLNLTIHGSTDPAATYVKYMNGETLEAGVIKLGTELGSASLVAVDSTITLTGNFYLGREQSPGFSKLSSSLYLTNTVLTCGSGKDFIMGYDIAGSGPVSADIGPGSVLTCRRVYRYASPAPTLRFTGGRIVLAAGGSTTHVFAMEGHTWTGDWPDNGVEVRGENAPIDIEVPAVGRRLAGGWAGRKVSLSGNGGFVKRGSGTLLWGWYTYGNNNGTLSGNATYTGDTVIKGGCIELATPTNLPLNAQIRFSTPSSSALKIEQGAYFNFAGNSASFLGVSGAGMITNSSATATTLTLGSSGGSGEYSPAVVGGSFDVVKLGAGTLTVGTTSIDGTLYVSNGTVKVASGATFVCGNIVAKSGTTVDVRGAHVTCTSFPNGNGVTILKDAGTVIDCAVEMNEDETWLGGVLSSYGDLCKTGSGTLTLLGPSGKSAGSVAIQQGSVVCKPTGSFDGTYYKIKYYGSVNKNAQTGVSFSEFSIYDINGSRINGGTYAYNQLPAAETQMYGGFGGIDDATQLAEHEVAVWMPNHNGFFQLINDGKGYSPKYIFDGDAATGLWNIYYWDSSNVLVFRIPDGSQAAAGFTFTTDSGPSRRPTQWKLEGSANGIDWTVLADNATNTADEATWAFLTNSTPATANTEYSIQALDKIPASSAYAPFGDAEVSVASGAMLEFASDEMLLSHLCVDMDAGGGSITRFTPAENGTINLLSTSKVAADSMIPLSVSEVASPENFGSWTVMVNGDVCANMKVRWRNGGLYVKGGAFVIVVR